MFTFITPEKYFKVQNRNCGHSLLELKEMARNKGSCEVCGQPIWKLGNTGLCFTCTTGEADNSDDYELTLKEAP